MSAPPFGDRNEARYEGLKAFVAGDYSNPYRMTTYAKDWAEGQQIGMDRCHEILMNTVDGIAAYLREHRNIEWASNAFVGSA